MKIRATGGLVWLSLSLVLVGCGFREQTREPVEERAVEVVAAPPEVSRDGFVGSQACAECHAEINRRYASHPMANSLAPVGSEKLVETYAGEPRVEPTKATRYEVLRDEEKLIHREVKFSGAGDICEQSEDIAFVLGSGRRGRSYVIDRDGFLFMSPVSWYSTEKKWDLAPNYLPDDHQRFSRPATERCLTCHAGRMNYTAREHGEILKYAEQPFAEFGVGCERCHGPGKDHIQFRHTGQTGADPIVNPVQLDSVRRDAVCNQCHLQGEQQILRYGRRHSDFRPGNYIGDIWSVYVRGDGISDDVTTSVSQVQQMQASRCYQESQGQLGCVSCHDPHGLPAPEREVQFYNDKCSACHQPDSCAQPEPERLAAPEAGSCIGCHMPRMAASDIPHTSQTDHRLLRDPKSEPVSDGKARQQIRIFDLEDCPLEAREFKRAQAIFTANVAVFNEDQNIGLAALKIMDEIVEAFPDDLTLLDLRALMLALTGQPGAIEQWAAVVEQDPGHESAQAALARTDFQTGRILKGIERLQKAAEVNPWQAKRQFDLSRALHQVENHAAALAAAKLAVQLDASNPEYVLWLARMYYLSGEVSLGDRLSDVHARLLQISD